MTPDTDRDSVPVVAWMTHHDEPMMFPTQAECAKYCDDDEEPIGLVHQSDHLAALASLTQRCEAAERLLDEAQTHAYAEGRRDEREELNATSPLPDA
ncbi:hypothetical protein [Methylibium sp.]|uniref:hypothetical protein n=1 Tax=Methylibium sp. TaxID=2067992 RepID=UPI0018528320|nr:hypothetical protein [Methylibium sp.]MBA3588223.1 hypothetical protein [Methylibium sp.]